MASPQQLSSVLRDLQHLGRVFPRSEAAQAAQGGMILDAFMRLAPFTSGAVYLREGRERTLKLAASRDLLGAPPSIEFDVPDDVLDGAVQFTAFDLPGSRTIVPLRHIREQYGIVALSRGETAEVDDERDLLRAVSSYLSAILDSQRMATEVRQGDFQLKYRLWELESLYDIGLSIASTLDLDKLADEILVRTISLLNARRAALFLRRVGRFELHRSFGEVRSQFLDEELSPEVNARLIENAESIVFDDQADCIFPDCCSFIALPIRSGQEVIGVLAASDREQREGGVGPFESNDLRMLGLFANQAAIALENARLHQDALQKQAMERELELAATIQRDILPRGIPTVPGYEIASFNRPARQLGGDYHAFFSSEGMLTVCVADVAGKSVPAAVLVSALHAALQLLVDEGRSLGEIATELNRHIHRWSSENKFITLVLATVDRESESIYFVNAGHNPAYVVTDGKLDLLHSHGLPIGILPQTVYRTQSRRFPKGSLLLVYSDGIVEAESVAGEEFENRRLEEILLANAAASPAGVRDAIMVDVDQFTAGAPQKDDQTMVLVRADA
jgi:sigma-B regulation protein RsbU (phosphoserine phosphatase)